MGCPNGQVDWIFKLGNRAFRLRPPLYWSHDSVNENNRNISPAILEKLEAKAKKYSQEVCKEISIDCNSFEETAKITYSLKPKTTAKLLKTCNANQNLGRHHSHLLSDQSKSIKNFCQNLDEWVAVQDIKGRIYYWNKKYNITQWEKPINSKK